MRLLLLCLRFIRGSRGLASLLPALLSSGLLALVITAVTLQTQAVPASGFIAAWLESCFVAWPIAFPLVYLIVARRTKPLPETAAHRPRPVCSQY